MNFLSGFRSYTLTEAQYPGIFMILTSRQHRNRAKVLRRNAPNLQMKDRALAHKLAAIHIALARIQERNPVRALKLATVAQLMKTAADTTVI